MHYIVLHYSLRSILNVFKKQLWYICRLKSFLADDKQIFTHFPLFFSCIIDIFLLLHYFHFSLLYILSSVEIFKTKWYGFQNTMLCIGLLYNSCSHLRPIRLLFLSLNFIICSVLLQLMWSSILVFFCQYHSTTYISFRYHWWCGWDSIVYIANSYELGGLEFKLWWMKDFVQPSRLAPRPTPPSVQRVL